MFKSLRTTPGFIVLCLIALTTSAVAAEAVNQYCPVTPDEPAESYITTEYKGQTIGFCCKRCLRKFIADPEAYIANLPHDNTDTQAIYDASGKEQNPGNNEGVAPGQSPSHEHNHSTDHAESDESPVLIFLGKLHVLSVHLPIALLPIAAILEILGWVFRSRSLLFAARTNFVLGAVTAMIAASLGWIAASLSHYPDDLATVLLWHRWLGVTVASISLLGLLGILGMQKSKSWGTVLYRTVIFVLLVLVPITAHFGGTLIYGLDYLF